MIFFYLALGLLLVLVLHSGLHYWSQLPGAAAARWVRWSLVAVGLLIALWLLRSGLPHLAALGGGAAMLLGLAGRWLPPLLRLLGLYKAVQSARKQRRATSGQNRRTDSGAMTADEARAMLGVSQEAGPEEIRQAYHKLMQKLHPDHGGNDYLAAQLNQAKEILLNQRERRE